MQAKILIVDDEEALCKALAQLLRMDGFLVDSAHSGEQALEMIEREDYNLIYLDYRLPGMDGLEVLRRLEAMHITAPVVFMTAHGDDDTGLESMTLGAREFLHKPCNTKNLRFKAFLWLRHDYMEAQAAAARRATARTTADIIYRSEAMQRVMQLVDDAAPGAAPVLICGETGTGKEVIAQAIATHPNNPRRGAPWAAVNCAAIPEPLMESELFGHVKGAFTGASSDKQGFFETAHNGTLFLDEISSSSLALQARLLRVLESGEYYRVGETAVRTTRARILAATNQDLESEIQRGAFREDLYHRLCVVRIDLPPLRERREDIPLFIQSFLPRFNAENNKRVALSPDAQDALTAYAWPGNIRELKHLLQHLVVTAHKPELGAADLPERIRCKPDAAPGTYSDMKAEADELVKRCERDYLKDLIIASRGNVSQAARTAGISRAYIIRKLNAHGINPRELA